MPEVQYRRGLRAAVRGLWTGILNLDQFTNEMQLAINRHLTIAWLEGAADCNVSQGKMTHEAWIVLGRLLRDEYIWIGGLGEAIQKNSKANKGKLGPLYSRLKVWIGRYGGVKAHARAVTCGDKNLKWVLGATESSCNSCRSLNNIVKPASFWAAAGILPRVHNAPYLECRGFGCDCQLVPTDEPITKDPLPDLP